MRTAHKLRGSTPLLQAQSPPATFFSRVRNLQACKRSQTALDHDDLIQKPFPFDFVHTRHSLHAHRALHTFVACILYDTRRAHWAAASSCCTISRRGHGCHRSKPVGVNRSAAHNRHGIAIEVYLGWLKACRGLSRITYNRTKAISRSLYTVLPYTAARLSSLRISIVTLLGGSSDMTLALLEYHQQQVGFIFNKDEESKRSRNRASTRRDCSTRSSRFC